MDNGNPTKGHQKPGENTTSRDDPRSTTTEQVRNKELESMMESHVKSTPLSKD